MKLTWLKSHSLVTLLLTYSATRKVFTILHDASLGTIAGEVHLLRYGTQQGKDLTCGTEAPLPPRVLRDIPDETVKALADCLVLFLGSDDNYCYWCCITVSRSTCHAGSHR